MLLDRAGEQWTDLGKPLEIVPPYGDSVLRFCKIDRLNRQQPNSGSSEIGLQAPAGVIAPPGQVTRKDWFQMTPSTIRLSAPVVTCSCREFEGIPLHSACGVRIRTTPQNCEHAVSATLRICPLASHSARKTSYVNPAGAWGEFLHEGLRQAENSAFRGTSEETTTDVRDRASAARYRRSAGDERPGNAARPSPTARRRQDRPARARAGSPRSLLCPRGNAAKRLAGPPAHRGRALPPLRVACQVRDDRPMSPVCGGAR